MKHKILSFLIPIFILSLFISSNETSIYSKINLNLSKLNSFHPQSVKKPKHDYLSTYLSRDTKPLGLQENQALKKYLDQSCIKWAIRANESHILN